MSNTARRFAAIAAFLCPAAVDAASLCVNPRDGACQATIQAAVEAARAGDTIHISPGVYFENVVVPSGKDGLRLTGSGRLATLVDPDVPNSGDGIRIESNDVEISALGVRNGQEHAISVGAGVSGTLVRWVAATGGRGPSAIHAEAGSTRLRILSSEVRAAGAIGIELAGANDGSTIKLNVVTQVERGIVASGEALEVASNRISTTRLDGIRVEGPRPVVTNNVIESGILNAETGLAVVGTNPTVRGNRLVNAGPAFVSCTACSGGLVMQNSSLATVGLASPIPGFQIRADASGLVVRGNRVSRASGPAFLIEGTGIRVTRNVAIDTGIPGSGDGFLVQGAGPHTLDHNVATRCSASGFRVDGDDVTLDANVATSSGLNGFLVFGAAGANSDVVLTNNRAIASNAAGFAVTGDGVSTVLTDNRGSGNRYDFCDDGVGTDVSGGNQFETTSTVCDVVQ
jgi:hypothetical protein